MKRGFTLIELVIVIVILGLLAAVAIPKFIDLITDAKVSTTKAGLGSIRGVIALSYSKAAAAGTPAYPTTVTTGNFFDGKLPVNSLNNLSAITSLSAAETQGTLTSATYGWWFVTTGTQGGQAGAYSDGTQDTSTW